MGYYRAGDYYRAGNYYRAGGLFDFLGKAVSSVGHAVGSLNIPVVSGIANAAAGVVDSITSHSSAPSTTLAPVTAARSHGGAQSMAVGPFDFSSTSTAAPAPGHRIRRAAHALMPGLVHGVRSRHMRVTNEKALKRAERRLKGFEKLAKRALRPLGLHVTRHMCKHSRPFGRKR